MAASAPALLSLATPFDTERVLDSERIGAALLEGWSDEGIWKIILPWPEEVRELPWSEAHEWPDLVRALERETPLDDPLPAAPFLGGWVGFLSYEAAATVEAVRPRENLPPEPAAFFSRHRAGVLVDPAGWQYLFAPEEDMARYLRELDSKTVTKRPRSAARQRELDDSLAGEAFATAVATIREAIACGDVYQVNLTRRFSLSTACDPAALYRALTGTVPPRSSAFLRGDGWCVVSASPEVLLRFDRRSGIAESRPIKGTVRRRGDDENEIAALLGSDKDASEHLMIVDLVRNDLGKIAPPGRVSVSEYRTVQTLEHVHHLESTVRAEGLRDFSTADLLVALSPAGSITGAPKRAAVEVIRKLEPVPRGVYCGSIGFLDVRGKSEMSVAIRTAVVTPDSVRYHAGGGIVWDSTAAAEDAESRAKSAAFLDYWG